MKSKKFLIAGGNSTLLVWNCPLSKRNAVAKGHLGEVEQVGFVARGENGIPQLVMMGNELSINGTIAFASQLGNHGQLLTSGSNSLVTYRNEGGITTIELSLPVKRDNDIIVFSGIGYKFANHQIGVSAKELSALARKYGLPAFGVAIYQNAILTPYVYVEGTQSLLQETACGSGSIATSLVTGIENIIQPTGESISIKKVGGKFQIKARVTEITGRPHPDSRIHSGLKNFTHSN